MAEPALEIGRVEQMLALRGFPGWSGLGAPEVATLAELARPRAVKAGEFLVSLEEPVVSTYVVVRGALRARRHGKDLGRYGPGTGVGGLAAFGKATDGYEVEAEEDSVVLEMSVAALEEVFEDRFNILSHLLRELSRQSLRLRRELFPSAGYPEVAETGEACPARRLDLIERIFYLRKNLAMQGVVDSVAVLAKAAEEIRLGPDELLWRHGDESDHMIALLCGRIRCTSPEGHVFELGAGDLVGSLDANAEVPRWYEARVIDGVVGLLLPRDITLDVWEDHPELGMKLLGAFSRQVLRLLEQREP